MTSPISRIRDRLVNAALGTDLRGHLVGNQQSLARLESAARERDDDIAFIKRRQLVQLKVERAERDRMPALTAELARLRRTAAYRSAFEQTEPLVTVRIASYRKTEELMDVAIASVRGQTYTNFEIVVVNDGPNEATRRAIAALDDSRIRYEEFDRRQEYPADRHARWMVAGAPGANRGADLANGDWIAPLDDDDEFLPDHIEKLVALALAERVELAYGALIQRNLVNNTAARIWSFPPAISQFSFLAAIYLRRLHPHFQWDTESWLVDEPGDWNLARRMVAAGVTMAATEDVVTTVNQVPYTHKADED